ncbi:MAG: hypothetical protein IJV27_08190 [Prevotella sp.]|nr:hypothetical protein [Prevotella sp.]
MQNEINPLVFLPPSATCFIAKSLETGSQSAKKNRSFRQPSVGIQTLLTANVVLLSVAAVVSLFCKRAENEWQAHVLCQKK